MTRKTLGRIAVTLALVAVAGFSLWWMWQHYMLQPWTRDGRVRANIIAIAPDVSGRVIHLHVRDNQAVEAGQLLFEIDPERYRLERERAEAALAAARRQSELQEFEAGNRLRLGPEAISAEQREEAISAADQARARLNEAQSQLALAQLNLERTQVRAPVAGYVTNLLVSEGDYARAGEPNLALIDRDFWVTGYFEETKLPRIHPGDRATIHLLGHDTPLYGQVESISRGIVDASVRDPKALLPEVNATYHWVRLAQRIPVRIALDPVPEDIELSAGLSATIILTPDNHKQPRTDQFKTE